MARDPAPLISLTFGLLGVVALILFFPAAVVLALIGGGFGLVAIRISGRPVATVVALILNLAVAIVWVVGVWILQS